MPERQLGADPVLDAIDVARGKYVINDCSIDQLDLRNAPHIWILIKDAGNWDALKFAIRTGDLTEAKRLKYSTKPEIDTRYNEMCALLEECLMRRLRTAVTLPDPGFKNADYRVLISAVDILWQLRARILAAGSPAGVHPAQGSALPEGELDELEDLPDKGLPANAPQ